MDLDTTIDDALERIHLHADENERGFTSHAPMVVDALVALGRADRIAPFLDAYLDDFPASSHDTAADAEVWLGRIDAADDWREVLDPAFARLAPATFAAATHGLIRAAHAVRTLERGDTRTRRRELARAFAYWEASEAGLPGAPGAASDAGLDAADLLAELEEVPIELRSSGLFTEGVAVLEEHAPFVEAIERLRVPAAVSGEDVSRVTRAMLPAYFESPLLRIAYVHTITAPSALRLVAPHVAADTLRSLYAHGVQAVAALHAISRLPAEHTLPDEAHALARDDDTLASRAADTLEEHVIKFTEACLREREATGEERFALAAADAIVAEETRASGGG